MVERAGWRADLPHLRPTSRTELWAQIRDQIAERVLDGRIPHDKVWAQEELAEALGVSRGTTIRAYTALQEDGLLVFARGRGCFSPTAEEAVDTLITTPQTISIALGAGLIAATATGRCSWRCRLSWAWPRHICSRVGSNAEDSPAQ